MPTPHRHRRAAFTMVELAIVVALISITAMIGYGSVREQLPRFRMVQVSKQLRSDIALLRNTAIETNRETRLLLVGADSSWTDPAAPQAGSWKLQVGNKNLGSTSWDTLPMDAQVDGSDDEGGLGSFDLAEGGNLASPHISLAPWSTLKGPFLGNGDAIVFSPRGFVANPDGDFGSQGSITITLVNKEALEDGVDDRIFLEVSRSGVVLAETSLGDNDRGTLGSATASGAP